MAPSPSLAVALPRSVTGILLDAVLAVRPDVWRQRVGRFRLVAGEALQRRERLLSLVPGSVLPEHALGRDLR